MTINRRKISFLALGAVLWGLAMGITLPAHAVYVSNTGLGEVLIYPYYTVQGGTDTYLSVVNTTDEAKAVKVRFTEGKNSREVIDFNLYLSPYDMWTAAVVATDDGAKLITRDLSCTTPAIPEAGVNFVNYAYTLSSSGSTAVVEGITNSGNDGEDQTLARTREGYFEIIEMGVLGATYAAAVNHVDGEPVKCSTVQAAGVTMATFLADGTTPNPNAVGVTTGGLGGTATLINVANGTEFSYEPTVLSEFNNSDNIWYFPGDIQPDMSDATPESTVLGLVTPDDLWINGFDAVSAVLMRSNLINEFILDSDTLSGTDWVVTMPTKRHYVPVNDGSSTTGTPSPASGIDPFTSAFWVKGACEEMRLKWWDREEQSPVPPAGGVEFSPPQPGAPAPGTYLCWETSILTFNDSNVLQSELSNNLDVTYENGWMNMSFNFPVSDSDPTPTHSLMGSNNTFIGLPAIGFMVQDFVNGDVGGVLSNYGGNFDHKYVVTLSP